MFLGGKARPVCRAEKHAAICEPIIYKCVILNISQLYRCPWPVTGIALLFFTAVILYEEVLKCCVLH
jgi:hypothetical protein